MTIMGKLGDKMERLREKGIPAAAVRKVTGKLLSRVVMYALLIGLAFVFLYPFLYMLVTSIKSPVDLTDITVNWLVNEVYWENYQLAFDVLNYPRRLFNTCLVALLSVLGHVIACSFIGYGFARFKFRFKSFWFGALVLSIIVPVQTIIVPLYILFVRLGWAGTYLPIIIPCFFGFGLRGALFIFLFRQFFLSLPQALEEAAAIDGCGPIRTYLRVALPNARSSILVCTVLGLVWHWNDVFEPSIYLDKQDTFFLPQMLPLLYDLGSNYGARDPSDVASLFNDATAMAATTLVILPLIVFYLLLQGRFMQSFERSGITG